MKKDVKTRHIICCMLLILISFVSSTCPVLGQVSQKKLLTKEDYSKWSSLQAHSISPNGDWTSYSVQYESGEDTLFVIATDGKKKFVYPKGRKPTFSSAEWFASLQGKSTLVLLSLRTGKEERFENVVKFEFSGDGKKLVTVGKRVGLTQELTIINLENKSVTTLKNVSSYSFNDDFTNLSYSTEKEGNSVLTVLSLSKNLGTLETLALKGRVSIIVWQANNKSIAFTLIPLDNAEKSIHSACKLGYYIFATKKMYFLDPLKTTGFPEGYQINVLYNDHLNISDDGMRIQVLFAPIVKTDTQPANDVEVWIGADSNIYSEKSLTGNAKAPPKICVWHPFSETVINYMGSDTSLLLSGNGTLALSSNLKSCGPQFKYDNDQDYYLTDLMNGSRTQILSCHTGHPFYTYMSPQGKYVAYFKEGNWFTYDVKREVHRNLTKEAGVAFYDVNDDQAGSPDVYFLAGWSRDDSSIFVYDQFDLWQINTDGSGRKRLTNGRAEGIVYRLASINLSKKMQAFLSREPPTIIDLGSPILLFTNDYDGSRQGQSLLERGKIHSLFFEAKKISSVFRSSTKKCFVYVEETYEKAPRLVYKKDNNKIAKVLFQSNPQQSKYYWSFNKTINYTNKKGKQIKGLLYYPINYNPKKKYPMLVNIYEQQYFLKNKFISPSLLNSNGINFTNYVIDGYFVFLPDIVYEVGLPGDSALDCVTAGVEAVLDLNVVNPEKIGLTGHSFGGYETTYIIGKSKLFAAAVGGASQTDLISCYLSVSENYKRSEFWRFEDYTNRMGSMLFDDLENYINNSPVYNAATVSTPLLLWTGDKDGVVAPTQSMELFLALRRLGKNVSLLRYRNENHVISNESSQIDLTLKIADWFNYYLKDEPFKPWMEANKDY